MATKNKISNTERELQGLQQNFRIQMENLSWYADAQIVQVKDMNGVAREVTQLLSDISIIVHERDTLIRDLRYLSKGMLDEVTRLERGQMSDDVTRNSTFTNLAQQVGIFNFKLKQAAIKAYELKVWIPELYPHLNRLTLVDLQKQAQARRQIMLSTSVNDTESLGRAIGDNREFMFFIEQKLRRG